MSKTHCKYGHERSVDKVDKQGNCKRCRQDYMRRYRVDNPRPATGTKGGGNEHSGRGLSPERKALLDAAVKDCWPIRQIIATYGIGTSTVKKHYPDYRGMPLEESIALSRASRRLNQKLQQCA